MTSIPIRSVRSYLYVPADRPERFGAAIGRGADAIILDLEDAVPALSKDAARGAVQAWLAEMPGRGEASTRGEVWVRVNAGPLEQDLQAVVRPGVAGVVIPKAEPELLAQADRLISAREAARGLSDRGLAVLALIETPSGLLRAAEIARTPRVLRLGLGEADLAAELRLQLSDTRSELTSLRLQIVLASAAAAIAAPVGPVSTDYQDLDALEHSTRDLLRLGFRARTAIHPAQVEVINRVFSPADDEVAAARRLVATFDEAERNGLGITTDAEGRMVDLAVIRSARETLAWAEQAAPRG
jgi:citrate lyase subunit beta/citryl-CoA lyase